MKNIYLFLLLLLLIGCTSNPLKLKKSSFSVECPPIYFSAEHRNYLYILSNNSSLESAVYKAEINNAAFRADCMINESFFSSDLSILFIVKPLKKMNSNIALPFYIAVLDDQENIHDIQYFLTEGDFKKNPETNEFLETEIIKTINFNYPKSDEFLSIVIGFMINEKTYEILD